jgi:mRNA interferase RelE/StbE
LVKPSAIRDIEALGTKRDRQRVVSRIEALAAEPRPQGCEKLAGTDALFRVRQGRYRVVYAVNDAERTVEVIMVGHRREIYRKAP